MSGGDDGGAEGESAEGVFEVDGGDDFQEFVGSVAAQAADFKGGVGEGDALCGKEGAESLFVEGVAGVGEEVVFVLEEGEPEDAPHVVLEVGVVEVHFPACARGREAAKHEDAGVGGVEGRERMSFGHGLSGLEEEVQEGEFIGFGSEAEDGAAADGGEEGGVAERLAAGEVGEVDFDDGDGDGGNGIGDGDGGVGVAAGVEDDAVEGAGGGLDAVDEFTFEVGLEVVDGCGGVFGAEFAEAVVERAGAVD